MFHYEEQQKRENKILGDFRSLIAQKKDFYKASGK